MNRLKKCLLLALLLCLVLPLCAAYAQGESAAERGLEKIKTAQNWDAIVLPREESYLDEWKTLYARKAWYAPSLFVETMPMQKSGVVPQGFLFEGTEVTVVAEENDMSCIVYRGENHKLCTGWVVSVRLLEDFPGPTYNIGSAPDGDFDTIHEAPMKWSAGYLPETEQRYTVLDEPVKGCVGFTLEYQIIADNTSLKNMLWGDRTVWVSDGENWTPLGVFPYLENGAVHVQVRLPEAMDISEIATVAHCKAPNIFDFRQTAKDFLVVK